MVHDKKLAKIWKQVFKKLNSLCENINHYFSYKLTHAIHGYDIFQKYLALHGHVFESKEVTHSSGIHVARWSMYFGKDVSINFFYNYLTLNSICLVRCTLPLLKHVHV